MEQGYPFIFQMNDYPLHPDGLLQYTMQYRFTSTKSKHKYIVRVERYDQHAYCAKFFDKANMLSDNKFSLRSNTFEARRVLITVFNVMFDVFKRDPKASFFYIGAQDEKDRPGAETRRFRIYKRLTLSLVSEEFFQHYRNSSLSLYILVNKKAVPVPDEYIQEITQHVREEQHA